MLVLGQGVRSAVVEHARRAAPTEACGLFAGRPGHEVVSHFFPTTNTTPSPVSFTVDPREMLETERRADQLGLEIMGVMHSHPATDAYPSATDISHATRFDPLGAWRSLIVSLATDEPSIRGFRIVDGAVEEEELQLPT